MWDAETDSNTVVFATRSEPPARSWWVGCDRDEFMRRHRVEERRMQSKRLPPMVANDLAAMERDAEAR